MNITDLMMTKNNLLPIFFVYSSVDRAFVDSIYVDLMKIGLRPWMDSKEVFPGMNWEIEILRALRRSQLVFIFLSNRSVKREGYFQREIKLALDLSDEKPEGSLFIIPIRIDDCSLPRSLNRYHYVDFLDSHEKGLKQLLKAINEKEEKLGLPLSNIQDLNKQEKEVQIDSGSRNTTMMNRLFSYFNAAKETTNIFANIFTTLDNLLLTQGGDVEKIAASQIKLLTGYYSLVLSQAQRSFAWALIYALAGFIAFIAAGIFLLTNSLSDVAYLSAIAGALIEVISGINFYLYNKSSNQLAKFHTRLDATQRILLANTICEKIEGDLKQKTRSQLALAFAGIKNPSVITEKQHILSTIKILNVNFDPIGKDNENEFVEVRNFGDEVIEMTDWELLDKANHQFCFPKFFLLPRKSVMIWTKTGKNTETELFWNRNLAIWNNAGDCAYLKNKDGVLVDFYCYVPEQKSGLIKRAPNSGYTLENSDAQAESSTVKSV